METIIHLATGDRRAFALRLLFARFPVEEQESRLREALAASERGTLNLDHLIVVEADGVPVGAALVMVQSDGVALVWPPVASCAATDAIAVEDLLMQDVCRRMDLAQARLGQCLLAPDDVVETNLLTRHGFHHAADMFFMARALTGAETDNHGSDVTDLLELSVESYCDQNADRFAEAIEATYDGSLDCPYLAGMRTGRDAIVSHKLSGIFDPTSWMIYSVNGRPAGVVLVNDHPEQDAVELIYIGVVPQARGLRLGRRMLREAIDTSLRRGRAVMFLAVDCQNRFANSLYGEFGFAELARRRIMLRHPGELARE